MRRAEAHARIDRHDDVPVRIRQQQRVERRPTRCRVERGGHELPAALEPLTAWPVVQATPGQVVVIVASPS